MSSVAKVPASPRARQSKSKGRLSVIKGAQRSQRARPGTDSALSSLLISPSTPLSSPPTVTHVSQRANRPLSECGDASVMPRYLSLHVQISHKEPSSEHFSGFLFRVERKITGHVRKQLIRSASGAHRLVLQTKSKDSSSNTGSRKNTHKIKAPAWKCCKEFFFFSYFFLC